MLSRTYSFASRAIGLNSSLIDKINIINSLGANEMNLPFIRPAIYLAINFVGSGHAKFVLKKCGICM